MFPAPSGALLLAFLTLQRLGELVLAQRNTRALLARGAYEYGRAHYPTMVALHATWLITLWCFAWNAPVVPMFLAGFFVLQLARVWVIGTLGKRWTTRIIIDPTAVPITTGPFRFVRHPNYLIVALELPCVSLAVGLWWHALLFGALNLAMLAFRIRSEDAAFAALVPVTAAK